MLFRVYNNKSYLIIAWWHHMVSQTLVNIGWDNGVLPGDTKALPEPMLIKHPWLRFCGFHLMLKIYPWYEFENY